MKTNQLSFRELLLSFSPNNDVHRVFQDFLSMCFCAFCTNPLTRLSYYEDEYLSIIKKYDKHYQNLFSDMLTRLVLQMGNSITKGISKDILGEVYQELFYKPRSGQFFTPEHITDFMASITCSPTEEMKSIIDLCCGSGRTLLSSARVIGKNHLFYGIDIDYTCVQMTVINLFLNGIFNAEVMCANALKYDGFHISYRTSLLPFDIFRITEKEKSALFQKRKNNITNTGEFTKHKQGSQLSIF
jgi:type I restriction-modification system DNA methylase subunit